MNPLVAHLVSGQILFTGLPLMILLIWGYERITRPELRRLTLALVWICGVFTLSTTAVPWWAIALLIASLGCWSARSWLAARQLPGWVILALPIGISVLLVAAEIPWTMCPTVALGDDRSIVVWGDSLSAGLGEGEGTPWPLQLRDAHRLKVHNLSEAGATTQDALRQIKSTDHFPGLVIVELGGNDLLGGRSCEAFAHDLDGILAYLHDHQRTVMMLELPVLPGKNQWGVVQRRLARKYDCQLVPKRLLVDVLASPGATVDTLHLTQLGHQRLAEMVWRVVGPVHAMGRHSTDKTNSRSPHVETTPHYEVGPDRQLATPSLPAVDGPVE